MANPSEQPSPPQHQAPEQPAPQDPASQRQASQRQASQQSVPQQPASAHDAPEARWLSTDESAAWLSLWTTTVWLPTRLDQQMRRDAGLSLVEYHSLSQIDMSPERTLRLSELASVTNMSLSHLSRVVTRLENAGLLRREPDPSDGRYTLAILTDAGHDRVVAAAPGHVEAVRTYVFDSLDEAQKAALGDALGAIAEALDPARIARL